MSDLAFQVLDERLRFKAGKALPTFDDLIQPLLDQTLLDAARAGAGAA